MDILKELDNAFQLAPSVRKPKIESLLSALAGKSDLVVKSAIDELSDELELLREENEEAKLRLKEINDEIGEIFKQKEYLTETALGADMTTFKEIQLAISNYNKQIHALEKKLKTSVQSRKTIKLINNY